MSGVAVTVLYVQRVPGDVFKNSIVTVSDLDKPLMGQEIFTTHWRLLHCFNLFWYVKMPEMILQKHLCTRFLRILSWKLPVALPHRGKSQEAKQNCALKLLITGLNDFVQFSSKKINLSYLLVAKGDIKTEERERERGGGGQKHEWQKLPGCTIAWNLHSTAQSGWLQYKNSPSD